ncbi:hypothetical protein RUM44_001210 [Polyplax serrata]|uniref:Uncharacterized protein n=1 Tax=Polyplax serrata TaxID=468196 RepID=A0ABR1BAL6_POLSC
MWVNGLAQFMLLLLTPCTIHRVFWSEVRKGFKPAKIAQKTEVDPPRKIPAGCYDTNDGFYNPRNLTLLSPTGELLRVPVCEEAQWIKKYCRKGFLEPTGFRPDLYENWYDGNFEFIDEILRQHEKFRQQKITYDELQQFYADNGLLSSCSKYQRRLTEHEILKIERNRGAIDPVKIRTKKVKKYIGHKLSDLLRSESSENLEKETTIATLSMKSLSTKKSKSFIKFNDDTRVKSVTGIASRMSKINFKISNDSLAATVDDTNASTTPKDIPHVYLSHQPIQRPPFQTRVKQRPPKTVSSKCVTRTESEANLPVDGGDDQLKHLKKKRLQKFMKDMILEIVVKFLLEERERHRSRLFWASKVVPHEKAPSSHKDKCLEVLENLFESIPEREEYTDSDPSKTCNFKKLSEDRYNTLKYWGKRLYTLDFDSDDKEENK